MLMTPEVEVRSEDFCLEQEYRALLERAGGSGACVLFSGLVRDWDNAAPLTALQLEHYPGMTEQRIAAIISTARQRWQINAIRVVHRVGLLQPGDQIVLVGVASAHRGDAFAACEYVMDYLKTQAPIWKKEIGPQSQRWVESRDSDCERAARWGESPAREEGP